MKRLNCFYFLAMILGFTNIVWAEEGVGTSASTKAGMAAIEKLGGLNGQALACRQMAISSKAKQALVAHAPKTQQSGDVFEAATNRVFLAPESCGNQQHMATELDAAIIELRVAFPSVRHEATTESSDPSAEIVTRYLLADYDGRAVSNQDFRGRFQLITFGYTYCPDVCPTTLSEMAAVMKALGDAAKKLQLIFITVDPERDTPALLKTYTQFFDPRILGLTGSPELIRRVADNYKVRFEKVQEAGAPADRYAMDHTAGMYLLGPDGRFLAKFPYAMPVQELTRRIGDYLKTAP